MVRSFLHVSRQPSFRRHLNGRPNTIKPTQAPGVFFGFETQGGGHHQPACEMSEVNQFIDLRRVAGATARRVDYRVKAID